MEKPAPVAHPVLEPIRKRWSPRAFADRPVEKDKLLSCLEAARWSASSYNEQPWFYFFAARDDAKEYERLLKCLVPMNQAWAKGAPVLMISVAKLFFARNNTPNRVAVHDVGLASSQLALQAVSLGLVVHQMAGIEVEQIRKEYSLPPGHDPVAGLAMGYPGDPASLPEQFREKEMEERTRREIGEFVFTGAWGKAAALK